MSEKVIAISKIASYITGTFAALGILWGVFNFVNTTNENNCAVSEMSIKIDSLYNKLDGVAIHSYRLGRSIGELQIDIVQLSESLDKTQKSYARYLMRDNTLTKEEFYKYMDGLTVEKVDWRDTLKTNIKIRKIEK
jgi:hypothetical protein